MVKAAGRVGRLATLSVRLTASGRDRLALAASENGRSLASEVEHRLDRSFERDDLRTIIREEIRAALRETRRDELEADAFFASLMPMHLCHG